MENFQLPWERENEKYVLIQAIKPQIWVVPISGQLFSDITGPSSYAYEL
jgi:hypothetical protein